MKKILLITLLLFAAQITWAQMDLIDESPVDPMPPYLSQLTDFGQRPDWSLDGKHVVFLEKTFGDVYEVEVATGKLTPLTHHYFHEGYTRALYLSNGDILLSGAKTFDHTEPWKSRMPEMAELWVLKRDLTGPPTPLGVFCKEGPTASRKSMKIAWTLDPAIYIGEIVYEDGTPKLINQEIVVEEKDLPEPITNWHLETQNFRPPNDEEIIFNAHFANIQYEAEVMGIKLKTKEITNYSMREDQYDEPEGIFPDGKYCLVESARHRPRYEKDGKKYKSWDVVDLYKIALDGSGDMERILSFNDNPLFKSANGVISDDGKFMAFQYSITTEIAGIGHGILILDFEKFEEFKQKQM